MVSENLGLAEDEYQLCFQSRFGPEEWLQPYTDKTLEKWAADGLPSVDTICPGFAVDCLETLEEMAEQNREVFLEAGGQQYHYIPCLNDSAAQIALFTDLAQQHLQGWEPSKPSSVLRSDYTFVNGHAQKTASLISEYDYWGKRPYPKRSLSAGGSTAPDGYNRPL